MRRSTRQTVRCWTRVLFRTSSCRVVRFALLPPLDSRPRRKGRRRRWRRGPGHAARDGRYFILVVGRSGTAGSTRWYVILFVRRCGTATSTRWYGVLFVRRSGTAGATRCYIILFVRRCGTAASTRWYCVLFVRRVGSAGATRWYCPGHRHAALCGLLYKLPLDSRHRLRERRRHWHYGPGVRPGRERRGRGPR